MFWKNLVLQKRKVCVTVFEIGLPVLFAGIMVLFRIAAYSEDITTPTLWNNSSISQSVAEGLVPPIRHGELRNRILYTPNTTITTQLMMQVQADIDAGSPYGTNVTWCE
jgi:ATP-binding cassette subfamily A (ABC1) protein 3